MREEERWLGAAEVEATYKARALSHASWGATLPHALGILQCSNQLGMSDLDLTRIAEHAEARVWADMVRAATPEIAESLGLRVVPFCGGAALVASNVFSVLYNRAMAFGLEEPVDEGSLDDVIALYRRDMPFTIQPSPFAQPPQLGSWLEARGLRSYFNWARWIRVARPHEAPKTDLRIEPIGPELADTLLDLAFTIFKEPIELRPWLGCAIGRRGWSFYLAYDGATPVGLGSLYVEGSIGWLGWGGTLASHRGRGAQSAMIARRIADGIERGCEWFISETAEDRPEKPNASFRNMARAGFRLLFLRPSYAHTPPTGEAPSDGSE